MQVIMHHKAASHRRHTFIILTKHATMEDKLDQDLSQAASRRQPTPTSRHTHTTPDRTHTRHGQANRPEAHRQPQRSQPTRTRHARPHTHATARAHARPASQPTEKHADSGSAASPRAHATPDRAPRRNTHTRTADHIMHARPPRDKEART